MPKFTIHWKAFSIIAEMTETERQELVASLDTLRQYVDFPKPHIMFSQKIFSYQEAREKIAERLAVSKLP